MLGKDDSDLSRAATKEERRGMFRGEGYKVKFIDFGFERGQIVGLRTERRQDAS